MSSDFRNVALDFFHGGNIVFDPKTHLLMRMHMPTDDKIILVAQGKFFTDTISLSNLSNVPLMTRFIKDLSKEVNSLDLTDANDSELLSQTNLLVQRLLKTPSFEDIRTDLEKLDHKTAYLNAAAVWRNSEGMSASELGLSDAVIRFFKEGMNDGDALKILDALDKIPQEHQEALVNSTCKFLNSIMLADDVCNILEALKDGDIITRTDELTDLILCLPVEGAPSKAVAEAILSLKDPQEIEILNLFKSFLKPDSTQDEKSSLLQAFQWNDKKHLVDDIKKLSDILIPKGSDLTEVVNFLNSIADLKSKEHIDDLIALSRKLIPQGANLSTKAAILNILIEVPDLYEAITKIAGFQLFPLSKKTHEQIKALGEAIKALPKEVYFYLNADFIAQSDRLIKPGMTGSEIAAILKALTLMPEDTNFKPYVDRVKEFESETMTGIHLARLLEFFIQVPDVQLPLTIEKLNAFKSLNLSDDEFIATLKLLPSRDSISKIALFASGSSALLKADKSVDVGGLASVQPLAILSDVLESVCVDLSDKLQEKLSPEQSKIKDKLLNCRRLLNEGKDHALKVLYARSKPDKISDLKTIATEIEENVKSLNPGETFFLPFSLTEGDKSGHAVSLEFTKQADGKYTLTVYNTGFGLNHHQRIGASSKYYPVVVKDVKLSSLNSSFFENLVSQEVFISFLSLSDKFKRFYRKIKSLGTSADESARPYNEQGSIGNCTYKSISKMLHAVLGEDYEFIKVLIHKKILKELKEMIGVPLAEFEGQKSQRIQSAISEHASHAAEEKPAIPDTKLDVLIKLSPKDGQPPSDAYMFCLADFLEDEILKTQKKIDNRGKV